MKTLGAGSAINENDLIKVENFAKDTGDFQGLSGVDLKVIALGLSIAKDKGEASKVNLTPQNLSEFRPRAFKKFYTNGEKHESDESSEDENPDQKPIDNQAWTNEVSQPKKGGGRSKNQPESNFDEFLETEKVENVRRKDIKTH